MLPLTASIVAVVVVLGCTSTKEIANGRPYPNYLRQDRTLDIQVFMLPTELTFTNTTATRFGPSTLWLNMWFSREIPSIEPGQTLTFKLKDFRDQYGDPFKPGGFWATETPDKLVLAQLETITDNETVLYGLLTIGKYEE